MSCQNLEAEFTAGIHRVQEQLNKELEQLGDDAARRGKQIADEVVAGQDTAEGVGAVAGTTIGGVLGGPAGAAVGGVIGKTIGSLFVIEIQMYRHTMSLDVPQTSMKTQKISFDLPEVELKEREIIFHTPSTIMERIKGPPIPHTKVEWKTECVGPRWARICTDLPQTTVWWEDTWLDVPKVIMEEQRIVFSVPEVSMKTQEISFDLPEIAMRTAEVSLDLPSISIRFIQDAGRKAAAEAAALAQSAQDSAAQKQLQFRARMKSEVAPLGAAMFACYRQEIMGQRMRQLTPFETQITALTAAMAALQQRGVPGDHDEMIAAKAGLQKAIDQRDKLAATFDQMLADYDKKTQEAMAKFLGDSNEKAGFVQEVGSWPLIQFQTAA